MFIPALFAAEMWKQPECPLMNEWIKKMWYIHRIEYHSVLGKKEILPFVATWMNLEDIILSEISQGSKIVKLVETERTVVAEVPEEGKIEVAV